MLLGIDFGLKRIGLAISEEANSVPVALKTVENYRIIDELTELIPGKGITKIIMGYPVKGNGDEGFIAQMTKTFMHKVQDKFPDVEIILVDESMSTKHAIETLRKQGYSAKSIEEKKDAEAARIILQAYIESPNN